MTVQAWVQYGQDVGDNKALTVRCSSDNGVGNRCGSHGVCRVTATSTVVHLNEYTCESTARFVAYQLPSTMLGTCSRTSSSLRKLSSMSVMCSACRVSSLTAENLQNDISDLRELARGGAREVDGPNTDVGLHAGTVFSNLFRHKQRHHLINH